MGKKYLAYKIPTSHFVSGQCSIVPGSKLEVCSCGKFTFVIVGRYRTKTDIISVCKTNIRNASRFYKNMYPFRIFTISKNEGGFENDACKTCGTEMVDVQVNAQGEQNEIEYEEPNFPKLPPLAVEKKLEMDLESIISFSRKNENNDNSDKRCDNNNNEETEIGCNGDSIHDPSLTKTKLDEELDTIVLLHEIDAVLDNMFYRKK
jgi:hypothetical protein